MDDWFKPFHDAGLKRLYRRIRAYKNIIYYDRLMYDDNDGAYILHRNIRLTTNKDNVYTHSIDDIPHTMSMNGMSQEEYITFMKHYVYLFDKENMYYGDDDFVNAHKDSGVEIVRSYKELKNIEDLP